MRRRYISYHLAWRMGSDAVQDEKLDIKHEKWRHKPITAPLQRPNLTPQLLSGSFCCSTASIEFPGYPQAT